MRVDSHQHFWRYDGQSHHFPWMKGDFACLGRNYSPDDLKPLLDGQGFDGTVAVQAREMPMETDDLLLLAAKYPIILGVVGWLDLCDPQIEAQVAKAALNPKLRGLRMLIHDQVDVDFADSSSHAHGVSLLQRYGLTYDLLLKPQHIASATRLIDQFPNQKFVVDHIAKPDIRQGQTEPWQSLMAEIAKRPNVSCKLSSVITQANWTSWTQSQIAPFLDHVLNVFGANRIMIGSDWPVSTCAADYASTMGLLTDWSRHLSAAEQAAFLGLNCIAFYGLKS